MRIQQYKVIIVGGRLQLPLRKLLFLSNLFEKIGENSSMGSRSSKRIIKEKRLSN